MTYMTIQSVDELKDFIDNPPEHTSINLRNFGIPIDIFNTFAESLKTNNTLTELGIIGIELEYDGAQALAEALKLNSKLIALNLASNNIGAEGAKVLAKGISSNSTLTTLNLDWNNIKSEGVTALAESLKENTALTNIGFWCNNIGDEGVKELAGALKENTTLISLDLQEMCIGEEGVKALAEALKENTTLARLGLNYRYLIASEYKEFIYTALLRNQKIFETVLSTVKSVMNLIEQDPGKGFKELLAYNGEKLAKKFPQHLRQYLKTPEVFKMALKEDLEYQAKIDSFNKYISDHLLTLTGVCKSFGLNKLSFMPKEVIKKITSYLSVDDIKMEIITEDTVKLTGDAVIVDDAVEVIG